MTLNELIVRDNNSFGVIRLVAASAVIFGHSFELTTGNFSDVPLNGLTALSLGQHSVVIFFVLSGLLVAASLDHTHSVMRFVQARVFRIFPALIVCVAATVLFVGPLYSVLGFGAYVTNPATLLYPIKTLSLSTGNAMLPGVFVANPVAGEINIPLWTIKYELACYLALALLPLIGLWKNIWLRGGVFALLVIAYVFALARPDIIVPWSSLDWMLNLAFAFAIGVAAYTLRHVLTIHWVGLVAVAVIFGLAWNTPFERAATPFFTGYAMLWISQFRFGPLRAWTNEIDLSFGIYIYGWLVQQCIVASLPNADYVMLNLFTAAVLLPIAYLSWTLVERPALRYRHHPVLDHAWQKLATVFSVYRFLPMAK